MRLPMDNKKTHNKLQKITQEVTRELLDGVWGSSGEHFISVRELARIKNISLVTAQRTFDNLRKERLLYLYNRSYYITTGRISERSALYTTIDKRTKSPHDLPIVGIHFPKISNEFFPTLLKDVIEAVRHEGYMPAVMFSNNDPELEKEILHQFIGLGARGVITCPNDGNQLKDIYSIYPLPVIYLANRNSFFDNNYVAVDDNTSAGHVAKHFVDMGYKNFMYVGFERNVDRDYRMDSFKRELEKLGQTLPHENIILLKETDKFAVPGYVSSIIASAKKPLGVFC